jgi:phage terminase large subunit-like protein
MAMTDTETIDIGQINSLRKHLKKLHSATAYAQTYARWNYYRPHPDTQLPFHCSPAKERSIVLGTQQGKTTAASFELAFRAVDYFPDWHSGPHPQPPAIERPQKFTGWYAGVSSQLVRDGAQLKLIGDISQDKGLGSGAIPLDYIEKITLARGIANFVDTVTVRRESGGHAILQSKTYEQSARMFQAVPCDLVWLDEDPGYDDTIYGECLGRTIATNGGIVVSLTPMLGLTPIRKRFIDGGPNIFQVRGGIEQALHIPKERHQAIIDATPARERAARIYGHEMQGSGAVFDTPIAQIKYERPPETFPAYWPVVWGCDLNHGGASESAHPFVAAFAFHDAANDVIFVNDLIVSDSPYPAMHVDAVKRHPCWDAPFLWPHDGARVGDMNSGDTLASMYRKRGLRLPHEHVTFKDGGYGLEAGLTEMRERFASGRLKIASHLAPFFAQYQNYHYKDGKVVRRDDDCLDAVRVIVMGIRHARPQNSLASNNFDGNSGPRLRPDGSDARIVIGGGINTDWDLHTGAVTRSIDDIVNAATRWRS